MNPTSCATKFWKVFNFFDKLPKSPFWYDALFCILIKNLSISDTLEFAPGIIGFPFEFNRTTWFFKKNRLLKIDYIIFKINMFPFQCPDFWFSQPRKKHYHSGQLRTMLCFNYHILFFKCNRFYSFCFSSGITVLRAEISSMRPIINFFPYLYILNERFLTFSLDIYI